MKKAPTATLWGLLFGYRSSRVMMMNHHHQRTASTAQLTLTAIHPKSLTNPTFLASPGPTSRLLEGRAPAKHWPKLLPLPPLL